MLGLRVLKVLKVPALPVPKEPRGLPVRRVQPVPKVRLVPKVTKEGRVLKAPPGHRGNKEPL